MIRQVQQDDSNDPVWDTGKGDWDKSDSDHCAQSGHRAQAIVPSLATLTGPNCAQSVTVWPQAHSNRVVTIQARPGDRDTRGFSAARTWEPRNTAAKGANSTCNTLYNTPVT
jgi:hypothetical protein